MDLHLAELTVKETLNFSARVLGPGTKKGADQRLLAFAMSSDSLIHSSASYEAKSGALSHIPVALHLVLLPMSYALAVSGIVLAILHGEARCR